VSQIKVTSALKIKNICVFCGSSPGKEKISKDKEGVEPEHCKEKIDSPPILPFPYVMTKQREVNHDSKIFETFKQEGIDDEKGTENVVADHLSRLTTDSRSDMTPIDDYFPYDQYFHFLML
jgi:hypothetical protein